jgi:hypothetical protein
MLQMHVFLKNTYVPEEYNSEEYMHFWGYLRSPLDWNVETFGLDYNSTGLC